MYLEKRLSENQKALKAFFESKGIEVYLDEDESGNVFAILDCFTNDGLNEAFTLNPFTPESFYAEVCEFDADSAIFDYACNIAYSDIYSEEYLRADLEAFFERIETIMHELQSIDFNNN